MSSFDVVIIGSGPGGYVSAETAGPAQLIVAPPRHRAHCGRTHPRRVQLRLLRTCLPGPADGRALGGGKRFGGGHQRLPLRPHHRRFGAGGRALSTGGRLVP